MAQHSWSSAARRFRQLHPELGGAGLRIAILDLDSSGEVDVLVSNRTELSASSQHTAALVSLLSSRATDSPGLLPDADLIGVPCFSRDPLAAPQALRTAIERTTHLEPHLVLLGGGLQRQIGDHGSARCRQGDCPLCRSTQKLVVEHDLPIVAPAGNDHRRQTTHEPRSPSEILCPANAPSVFAIAALDASPMRRIYPRSSRGHRVNGTTKPDLSAPGAQLLCQIPLGTGQQGSTPTFVDGTSAAAALAASVLGVLIQIRLLDKRTAPLASLRRDLLGLCAVSPEERELYPERVFGSAILDASRLFDLADSLIARRRS